MKHEVFLKWLLFNCIVIVGLYLANSYGLRTELFKDDAYNISVSICLIIAAIANYCSYLSMRTAYRIGNCLPKVNIPLRIMPTLERDMHSCNFMGGLCSSFGMFGTVLGFMMMMNGIGNMDLKNVDLTEFGAGMSVALGTTLIGLAARMYIRVQAFTCELGIDKIKEITDAK